MAIELVPLQVAAVRPQYGICLWSKDDRVPVQDFLLDMQSEDLAKFTALMERVVQSGLPRNDERYKKLKGYDNLHELKVKPFRFFFFIESRAGQQLIVLVDVYKKDANSTSRVVLERANRRKDEYYQEKGV